MFPKHRWVKYRLPKKALELMPDKNEQKYKDLIETNAKWGDFEG